MMTILFLRPAYFVPAVTRSAAETIMRWALVRFIGNAA
jgi:hypothetical protein